MHKLLIHGRKIIEALDLAVGCLSEELQEANNKIFRRARSEHSQMCNREKTNEDIMHYLLISSDPLISKLRIKESRQVKTFSKEAQDLVVD